MLRLIRFKLALTVMFLTACSLTSSDFQSDADILRLQHLEYYGTLLTEYYSKTGTYPFVGEIDVPAYIFVASPEQVDDIQGGPPHAHKTAEFKYLKRRALPPRKMIAAKSILPFNQPPFLIEFKIDLVTT